MATTVKVMLNDRNAILELVEDPEIQVKVKAAIVDEVGKRAAKAAQAVLDKTIEQAVQNAVSAFHFPRKGNPNGVFKKDCFGRVTLEPEIVKKIHDCVSLALTKQVYETLDAELEQKRKIIAEAMDLQLERAKGLDVEGLLKKAIEKVVQERFGGK